jgi:hypothetical protein
MENSVLFRSRNKKIPQFQFNNFMRLFSLIVALAMTEEIKILVWIRQQCNSEI